MVDGRSAKWQKWPGQHHCIIIIPAVRQPDAMRCDAVAFMANLIVAISMQALWMCHNVPWLDRHEFYSCPGARGHTFKYG